MKKLLGLLFIASILIYFSCSGGKSGSEEKSSKESSEEIKAKKLTNRNTEPIQTCEEFLDRYEEWVDLYIEVLKAYNEDPFDDETVNKYSKAMAEAPIWAQDWTKLHTCATKEKYQKRFEEIADKVNKALEEMRAE